MLLLELTVRLIRAPLHFGSFRELRIDMRKRNYPITLDPTLGYAPLPNFESTDNHWGTIVSIDADGIRRNGNTEPPTSQELLLAVGDSFTFGDQLDDDAAWPALLEHELQQPVKNGGVFGYSLTQSILRAEQLLQRFQPTTLIVSFIPGDLHRCALSKRYTPLPWFDLVNNELVLKGVPIDHTPRPPDSSKQWKDALGHSALLDALFASSNPTWWYENEKQVMIPHLWAHTATLGKRLVDRIAKTCQEQNVHLLLLLQSDHPNPESLEVMQHAQSIGVHTLDLASRFLTLAKDDPTLHDRWFDGHMTRAGNQWVATELAIALRKPR